MKTLVIQSRKMTALLIASILILLSASPALASFSFAPGNPNQEDPFLFRYTVAPGGTIEDEILAINRSKDDAVAVVLYGTDNEGATENVYKSRDKEMTGVGRWVSFKDNGIAVLDPEESLLVPFTIEIPEGTDDGTYVGGIVIEGADIDEVPEGLIKDGVSVGVKTRTASRLEITVDKNANKKVVIEKIESDRDSSGWSTQKIALSVIAALIVIALIWNVARSKEE